MIERPSLAAWDLVAGLCVCMVFALPAQAGIESAAKMGALFSGGIAVLSFVVGRLLGAEKLAGDFETPEGQTTDGLPALEPSPVRE